ncbi:FG-GAP-like repeat-containing protein [Aliikangiella maris]|uniref:FG-GAP-like repeat-containing protein n=2 Tax=Aliikangiella maris TaxID=3162458 RepID=A0ABV2BTN7_9GAMM
MIKPLLFILTLIFSFSCGAAKEIPFQQLSLKTDFKITHPIDSGKLINDKDQLIAIGENQQKQRILALFEFTESFNQLQQIQQVVIPANFQAYDLLTTKQGQQVIFQTHNAIYAYLPATNKFVKRLDCQSIYLDQHPQFLAKRQLVKDINQDGLDEIIIADFKQINFFWQSASGKFNLQQLPIRAKVRIRDDAATYSQVNLFFADMTQDQRPDLVLVENGALTVYSQQEAQFNDTPIRFQLPIDVRALEWWEVTESDGQTMDQHNLQYRTMGQITDLNNDQIADLIVRYSQTAGVLDRENSFEVFLGRIDNGVLLYSATPDSLIKTEGTTIDFKTVDIDQDKRLEVILTSLDIGISQIIGALLSGSIDQDVAVFKMDEQGRFNKKPNTNKEVDLKFSLSSGKSGAPVVVLEDFDGDGLKDLLLSDGEKTLRLYSGTPQDRLFERRSLKYKVVLPKDGNLVDIKDLNQDGRQDVVIRYGRQDDQQLTNQFMILLSKPAS